MADTKSSSPRAAAPEGELRQARVTTDSGEAMLALLKGREIELVGRGPHRLADGTFVAEIIAPRRVLSALAKELSKSFPDPLAEAHAEAHARHGGSIDIRPKRKVPAAAAPPLQGNRYLEAGSVPRGVGVKE